MITSALERILLVALPLVLGAGLLPAQVTGANGALLQPTELLDDAALGYGNDAYIRQAGNFNEVNLVQQQSGGAGNLAHIQQTGNWNVALMTQAGFENKLVLVQQGTLNYLELAGQGTENELAILQQGDNNSIIQHLLNSNQVTAELVQTGNHNEINSTLEGIQGGNYTIRQIGDGMKIILRQSSL